MRDPNNLIPVSINKDTIIEIHTIPEYNLEDYDLFDDKEFKKYISDIEKEVRTSFEYRGMIRFLKENLDMNKCAFFKNIGNLDMSKIKIEIHHDPFDLYNIVLIIFNKRKALRESLDVDLVAKEVMILHYNMYIGLIPLSTTVHELVHNGYLFIPTNKILGNYRELVNRYYDYLLPEQLDTLDRIEEATAEYENDKFKDVLASNYIYLDLTGAYDFPKMDDIKILLRNRIDEIRNDQNPNYIKPIDSNLQPLFYKE